MKPRLYKANETAFTNRGIGTLSDAILCDVTEVRNGEYELELEFPMSGKYYDEIQMQRYILASPGPGKIGQPFEIYDISKPMNGIVTFKARHISYKLNKVTVKPFTASSCTQALQALKTNSVNANPFTFWTNKSVTGTMNVKVPQQLRGLLGGQQGSILDTYGTGEYEWDRFTVRLWQHRGADRGVTIRYGKNLLDLTDEGDMGSVYTGIVPYYSGNEALVMLPELVLYGEHRDDYSYDMVIPVDLSSSFSGSETPTVEQLRQAAQKYLEKSEAWQIRNNIKINFVNLADTEEYRNVAALQRVDLCDTVTVIHEGLGVSAKAKVVKTVYDVLTEKYKEIELGSTQTSLSEAITETILEEVPTFDFMQEAIRNGTALITGGLGGYVILKPNANGKPEELLVMDTDDIATATNVWRFNKNGIGFSPNGYNGPYKQAWTIDGAFYTDWVTTGLMTANIIKAGILSDKAGKNSWNMVTGVFELNAAAKVGDTGYTLTQIKANAEGLQTKVEANGVISAINQTSETIKIQASKINLQGYVTATDLSSSGSTTVYGGRIRGGTLTLGGANNGNGQLSIVDASNAEVGHWDRLGITATAGTIGGWTIGGDILRKYTGTSGSVYRMLLYAPTNVTANATQAIQIAQGTLSGNTFTENSGGGYRRPFYVRYDGYLNAVGGGRIGTWTLGSGTDGALYNTRTALHTNKKGIYIGSDGIAVGGSNTSGETNPFFEANTTESVVYVTQLKFRNVKGNPSNYGWNLTGGAEDYIHTGGLIDCGESVSSSVGHHKLRGITDTTLGSGSDERLKKNIKAIDPAKAEAFIRNLRPVSFDYRKNAGVEGKHHGLIAQEVLPELEKFEKNSTLIVKDQDGYYGILYTEFIADLISVSQTLLKRVDELEEQLNGHTDRSH